jgi:glycosyltransferase involved in cell wall biosynthesis
MPNSNEILRWQRSNGLFISLVNFLYKLIDKLTASIVVHSSFFKDWLAEYNVDAEKVHVISHGIDTNINEPSQDSINYWLKKTGNHRIILSFGVLSPRKGLEQLIRAYKIVNANHPSTLLVIAGYEPAYYRGYKRKLLNLSRKLRLESKVVFTGSISEQDIEPLFIISEIVVFPYNNSFSASGPLSIALQFAKPIVATDTFFFKNELKDGKDCLLVQRNNYSALSTAIIKVLENKSLRDQLHFGAKSASMLNSWDQVACMTLRVYENIASNTENFPQDF